MEQQQQHTHIWNATNQTENSGYFVVVRSLATFTFYFFFSTFYFKHLCVCTFQKTATFKIRKKKKDPVFLFWREKMKEMNASNLVTWVLQVAKKKQQQQKKRFLYL